ncbi:MAG: SIR2 family NAD-dependent protein deacylase [Psychroflexus halocasei]|uniref:SIR2 family NAD-dependent protein deacylase n=1 Tax=Psychroflexus sp. S27 TaxID=1982757 RepID=UPI000C2A9FDA|nr:NAD-dependent deacylase [Psychroflexus sp. S27]PJX23990.1 NAD-dependent protein deacylase [Psychroflexus sp. S27]
MKKICVLTGAGMSAESGVKTFRDDDGLWENHEITEVATPEAFERNPELVLDFYNQRRRQLLEVKPNAAHLDLVRLEEKYDVQIITQNVDDLHERAGSSSILHLHGELMKSRSVEHPHLIYNQIDDLNLGDLCENNYQLRPHIVWFGEAVPEMENAIKLVSEADIIIIIGTSMQVYPAAGLIDYKKEEAPVYFIDPKPSIKSSDSIEVIAKKASLGVHELVNRLL